MDFPVPKKTNPGLLSVVAQPKHTLFELVLLGVVCVLFFFFLLQPKRAQLSTGKSQLQTVSEQNDTIQKNKQTLALLIDQLHSHPEDLSKLDEALPLQGRVTLFRIGLEKMIGDSGMQVGDIPIESNLQLVVAGNKEELANPYGKIRKVQKYTATVSVTGTMEQFQALLKTIEQSGRIIDISGMEVNSSKNNNLAFRINLQSYFYE